EMIETPGVLEQRGVAARTDVVQHPLHRLLDGWIGCEFDGIECGERRFEIRGPRVQSAKGLHAAAPTAASSLAISGASSARLSLSAALFTISRDEIATISSTSTRRFARSVPPLETRSTIASARPASGASSIEPYSLIRSTCTPLAAKNSRAHATYFVA